MQSFDLRGRERELFPFRLGQRAARSSSPARRWPPFCQRMGLLHHLVVGRLELSSAIRREKGSNCSTAGSPPARGLRGPESFRAGREPGWCDRPGCPDAPDIRATRPPAPTTSPPAKCNSPPASRIATRRNCGSFFFSSSMTNMLFQNLSGAGFRGRARKPISVCGVVAQRAGRTSRTAQTSRAWPPRRPRSSRTHCQSEPQPSTGCLPRVQQQQQRQRRHRRAGRRAQHELRKRQVAQNQVRGADKSETRPRTAAGC